MSAASAPVKAFRFRRQRGHVLQVFQTVSAERVIASRRDRRQYRSAKVERSAAGLLERHLAVAALRGRCSSRGLDFPGVVRRRHVGLRVRGVVRRIE